MINKLRNLLFISFFFSSLALSGCGQTGPLYLPTTETNTTSDPATNIEAEEESALIANVGL